MYQCPSCGGELRYDIASRMLKCESCMSEYDYHTFSDYQAVSGEESLGANVFQCPSCGGEIISTNLTAAEYCTYCGSFVMLDRKDGALEKPDCIIPFAVTREECKQTYRRHVRKAIYAPSSVKNPDYIDRFRGIYMPYWLYDTAIGPDIKLTGHTESREGNYDVKSIYSLTCKADISYEGIPFDASSSFRDDISSGITPFDTKGLEDFNPTVMLGFFADRADTKASLYEKDALNAAADTAFDVILSKTDFKDKNPSKPANLINAMQARITRTRSAMLPIWFLTWRKDDRVAYSVVNGQTGKVAAELPVAPLRYLLFSLLTTIPLFLLFERLFTFTVYTTLLISAALAMIMLFLYVYELNRIYGRESHEQDKGYLAVRGKAMELSKKAKAKKSQKDLFFNKTSLGSGIMMLIGLLIIINFFVGSISGEKIRNICFLVLLFLLFPLVSEAMGLVKSLSRKSISIGIGSAFVSVVVAAAIYFLDPARDIWYYAGTILAFLGIVITVLSLIRHYNLLVTEPAPHFFDREAGDRAEETVQQEPQENTRSLLWEKTVAAEARKTSGRRLRIPLLLLLAVLVIAGAIFVILRSDRLSLHDSSMSEIAEELAQTTDVTLQGNVNTSTGYSIALQDLAELLTPQEEQKLQQEMASITQFCDAGMVTEYVSGSGTEPYSKRKYAELFGSENGVLFIIDMGNRNIWLCADGDMKSVVTVGKANSITDNIYEYASDGDYYKCAAKAFSQVMTLLRGGRISQRMKHITNALLALILAFILNYALLLLTTSIDQAAADELLATVGVGIAVTGARTKLASVKRTYNPPSSGGGSGGGGGGGGGGASGGGHGF